MRYAERTREAEWAHGQRRRQYRSRWVIDTLAKYLPPEHVMLARYLAADQATAEGLKPQDYERVDNGRNAIEGAAISRLDAARKIAGFESSISRTLKRGGVLCFRSIVQGDTLQETIRRCGYASGADRSVRELVQITMIAAGDYDDLCRDDAGRWNGGNVLAMRA